MKMFGITLKSSSDEIVYVYGERYRRTVYHFPGKNEYFVKVYGEFIQVYRWSYYYSTQKGE